MTALRRASHSGRLLSHVDRVVAAYVPETTPPFATAVQYRLQIARVGL